MLHPEHNMDCNVCINVTYLFSAAMRIDGHWAEDAPTKHFNSPAAFDEEAVRAVKCF